MELSSAVMVAEGIQPLSSASRISNAARKHWLRAATRFLPHSAIYSSASSRTTHAVDKTDKPKWLTTSANKQLNGSAERQKS